ncbi:hypothetical protein HDU82_007081 [Entophlyctis luteolus]|nr:hypothetical protein HDU82_007081 [Entophlyctis luteolus]
MNSSTSLRADDIDIYYGSQSEALSFAINSYSNFPVSQSSETKSMNGFDASSGSMCFDFDSLYSMLVNPSDTGNPATFENFDVFDGNISEGDSSPIPNIKVNGTFGQEYHPRTTGADLPFYFPVHGSTIYSSQGQTPALSTASSPTIPMQLLHNTNIPTCPELNEVFGNAFEQRRQIQFGNWAAAGLNQTRKSLDIWAAWNNCLPILPGVVETTSDGLGITLVAETSRDTLGGRIFTCENCGKTFNRKYNLKKHEDTHGDRPRVAVCPKPGCGLSFVDSTGLRRHQATHDLSNRVHCNICLNEFARSDSLKRHQTSGACSRKK